VRRERESSHKASIRMEEKATREKMKIPEEENPGNQARKGQSDGRGRKDF